MCVCSFGYCGRNRRHISQPHLRFSCPCLCLINWRQPPSRTDEDSFAQFCTSQWPHTRRAHTCPFISAYNNRRAQRSEWLRVTVKVDNRKHRSEYLIEIKRVSLPVCLTIKFAILAATLICSVSMIQKPIRMHRTHRLNNRNSDRSSAERSGYHIEHIDKADHSC